jgi:hypothetical protein
MISTSFVGNNCGASSLIFSGGMFKAPGIWASRYRSGASVSTTIIYFRSSLAFRSSVEIVFSISISLQRHWIWMHSRSLRLVTYPAQPQARVAMKIFDPAASNSRSPLAEVLETRVGNKRHSAAKAGTTGYVRSPRRAVDSQPRGRLVSAVWCLAPRKCALATRFRR